MTRYARGKGSKGCNKKQENGSTSWRVLKAQSFCSKSDAEHTKSKEVSLRCQDNVPLPKTGNNEPWFDFCLKRKNDGMTKERFHDSNYRNPVKKLAKSKDTSSSHVSEKRKIGNQERKTTIYSERTGNASFSDKSVLKVERKSISALAPSITKARRKIKTNLSDQDRKELRRKEKALKREKKKVCFCCRRWGHQLADCPEFKPIGSSDISPPAGGLCYHCGSTEHNVNQCHKPGANSLKFARCFVCGEDGHLARHCQDNPKGKYPKGGSCRFCGETSHLCSDCPKGVNFVSEPENFLSCSDKGSVDSLPEDMGMQGQQSVGTWKIIQF